MKKGIFFTVASMVVIGLTFVSCTSSTNESESETPSLENFGSPKLIIQNGESINSGAQIIWDFEVESLYEDTYVGVGAWNYAGGIAYKTRIGCNGAFLKCSDIKQAVCNLLSSTGTYGIFQCYFADINGTIMSGDENEIRVPYSTYDYSKKEYVDTLMSISISSDDSGGKLIYEIPTIFNVSQGEFIDYQDPYK